MVLKLRHTALNKPFDELEDTIMEGMKAGETFGSDTSDYGTFFEFPTGGPLEIDDEWHLDAYVRLHVTQGVLDEWLVNEQHWFDYQDNP